MKSRYILCIKREGSEIEREQKGGKWHKKMRKMRKWSGTLEAHSSGCRSRAGSSWVEITWPHNASRDYGISISAVRCSNSLSNFPLYRTTLYFLSLSPSLCLSLSLSPLSVSITLSLIYLSVSHLYLHLSFYLSNYISVSFSTSLSPSLSLPLSLSLAAFSV